MKVLLIPLLAAVSQAANLLISKVGLTRRHIHLRDYLPGIFLWLAIFAWASLVKLGGINYDILLSPTIQLKFWLAMLAAVIWNVCYYTGVSKEKANTAEGIMLTMPLATIAISWLFDWSKFNVPIATIAILATVITTWAYAVRGLFKFDKYSFGLGIAVVLIALENVLVAQILSAGALSPATLYAVRTTIIFLVFYIYYRPRLRRLSRSHMKFLAISSLMGLVMMLLRFYGLRDAGVVTTALLLILSPAFVLVAAGKLLHERVKRRKLVAMGTVMLLVLYATYINYNLN